jgi:hypothetical protein
MKRSGLTRLEKRALELFEMNETWGPRKSLAAAIAEDHRKQEARRSGKVSVRQIGWLEDT